MRRRRSMGWALCAAILAACTRQGDTYIFNFTSPQDGGTAAVGSGEVAAAALPFDAGLPLGLFCDEMPGVRVELPASALVTLRYGARSPDPHACGDVDHEYTFRASTGLFTWRVCWNGTGVPDAGAYRLYAGSRVLNRADSASLRRALDDLQLRPHTIPCGGYKPEGTLRVELVGRPEALTYFDAYWSCADVSRPILRLEALYAAARLLPRDTDGTVLVGDRGLVDWCQ